MNSTPHASAQEPAHHPAQPIQTPVITWNIAHPPTHPPTLSPIFKHNTGCCVVQSRQSQPAKNITTHTHTPTHTSPPPTLTHTDTHKHLLSLSRAHKPELLPTPASPFFPPSCPGSTGPHASTIALISPILFGAHPLAILGPVFASDSSSTSGPRPSASRKPNH